MDRVNLLEEIRRAAAAGEITEADVTSAFRQGSGDSSADLGDRRSRYSRLLYYIGGGVVFMGIVGTVAQIWDDIGTAMRIVVTLGSGLAAFVSGVLLSWDGRLGAAGSAFFLIAALVLPLGMAVTMDEAGLDPEKPGLQTLIALVLMAAFLGMYALFRANSVLVISIGFGTWAFFAVVWFILGPTPRFDEEKIIQYQILAAGLAFMLLAWAFSDSDRQVLTGPLYAFGSFAFLGSALTLGGWEPNQSVFWELIFPGLVFALLYLSIHLKSLALLVFGSLYLAAYLAKITAEYFSESLGWPLALVLIGFILMGVGYLTLRLKRTYLEES